MQEIFFELYNVFKKNNNKNKTILKWLTFFFFTETEASIFSNERNSRREHSPALFEAAEDDGSDIYLPPGAGEFMIATEEGTSEVKEDYSDLLK